MILCTPSRWIYVECGVFDYGEHIENQILKCYKLDAFGGLLERTAIDFCSHCR